MRHHRLQRATAAGLLAAALCAPAAAQAVYKVPLESQQALENLMPSADLVARARYGDDAPLGFAELGLGSKAAPWTSQADANWVSGQTLDLRVTYDGFGRADLVVGSQALSVMTSGDFAALSISARAQAAGASARLYDVFLNGQPLHKGAKAVATGAASAFDGTLLQGAALRKGFVLSGKLRFVWSETPKGPGALLVEVRVGRLAPQMLRSCPSTPNSTGLAARIDWWGATSISSNKLALTVQDAPPFAACLFLVGGTQQSVPYGNGTLCVGPPLDRLADPDFLNELGQRTLLLDLSQGPLASGPLAVQPGDTRTFQVWFRDPAAGVDAFDLTDAITATFLP
jgi:hypothetical protein